ncbi:MAG: hypothetical protein U0S48_12350 [Solirubrobacteraceae bacterium]
MTAPKPTDLLEGTAVRPAMTQRLIDTQAPLLLRPVGDDPNDRRNWVLKAIERTGQSLDDAIATWMLGFAMGDDLIWSATAADKGEAEATRLHDQVWQAMPAKYRDAAQACFTFHSKSPPYGLEPVSVDEAVKRLELSREETLVLWNRAFTGRDHQAWLAWEDAYGAREAVIVYSRLWEGFALGFLDMIKHSLGMETFESTEDLAKLNRAYWEAIGSEVEDVEQTPDRLVAVIKTCPFFDNLVDMYGKEAASDMMKKTIGSTSSNYYQALTKALGLWDEYFVTQDRFRCLGDGECRMVYTRRSAMGNQA